MSVELDGDDLPLGVVNTQDPADVSLSPQESLARISVPDGFNVTLFAAEPNIRRPIAFDFDDRGRLWVVENYSHPKWKSDGAIDRIIILEDQDNDGCFDQRTVFWDRGRYVTGIAVGHGGVWIANTPELSFIPDRDQNDVPDSEPVVMLDGFQKSTNNVLNNFHWGPDGWLYGAIGLSENSLVGKPGTPETERTKITRGIWRFHPVDHVFEKVAEGMVNPWGADFNEYGDLITTNTVIAHLWHIVPGMYCERRAAERDNPFAYERIQTIANHLHWGGGGWQSSRSPDNQKDRKEAGRHEEHAADYHRHSVVGGGHAHCGAMIYLGDNWPEEYRGTFFTNNLHGSRVNNDRLVPKRSSYVGTHENDLFSANDPWFRGMSIKYGPDGGVYISDWHDIGECHDSDGSHRTTGRIYKFVYGEPEKRTFNLQTQTSLELAKLHTHPNEWFVRHARRILQERAAAGRDLTDAMGSLRQMLQHSQKEVHKLRALWSLYVINATDESELLQLLAHKNQHIRRWAVRLLVDRCAGDMSARHEGLSNTVSHQVLNSLTGLAEREKSAKVRLELACALQRIPVQERLSLAKRLLAHSEDTTDPYIPLMIWYGLEPAVIHNTDAALAVAIQSGLPRIRRFIARRAADSDSPAIEPVLLAARSVPDKAATVQRDLLAGLLNVLEGRGEQKPPASWDRLYSSIADSSDPMLRSIAVRLATIFGDENAIKSIRAQIVDNSIEPDDRREALRALLPLSNAVSADLLHQLVTSHPSLRQDALQALIVKNKTTTAGILLKQYDRLSATEKREAISVLVTRKGFAESLLSAIEADDVERRDVSAFALQQLRAFNVPEMQQRIEDIWADDVKRLSKSAEIARYKKTMSTEYLSHGNASAGRLVFERSCSKCHTLFGEGGTIAPNLTGSGRKKTDYVLQNLIDPNAEIDAAYRLTNVLTTDGRLLSGFIVQQTDKWLELRNQETRIRLAMKDVDELVTSRVSMMPEGMLRSLSDEQVRDLLVYLASEDQVPLPEIISGG